MAKKPVKTFHPLAVAASLEAQSQAVGLFLAKVNNLVTFADRLDLEQFREMAASLEPDIAKVRAVLWPEEE